MSASLLLNGKQTWITIMKWGAKCVLKHIGGNLKIYNQVKKSKIEKTQKEDF